MFAGVSTTYFPFESQIDIIEVLLEAIDAKILDEYTLVVRPVAANQPERERIIERYGIESALKYSGHKVSALGSPNHILGAM